MKIGWKKRQGFTIVELLIVIVVIGVLAAISLVAYTGIQNRAYDARIDSAVNQVEKALRIWGSENGNVIRGGNNSTTPAGALGCTDGSSGWIGAGSYVCSVEDTLVAAKLLPSGFTASLPNNAHYNPTAGGRLSIMLYTCSAVGSGNYALYWSLRSPTVEDSNSINTTLSSCGNTTNIRDSWGMRAAKIIQL